MGVIITVFRYLSPAKWLNVSASRVPKMWFALLGQSAPLWGPSFRPAGAVDCVLTVLAVRNFNTWLFCLPSPRRGGLGGGAVLGHSFFCHTHPSKPPPTSFQNCGLYLQDTRFFYIT